LAEEVEIRKKKRQKERKKVERGKKELYCKKEVPDDAKHSHCAMQLQH
jgi:hypothetical protein